MNGIAECGALESVAINGYTCNARRVALNPEDAVLIYSYVAARNLSVQAGLLFQGRSVLVDVEYFDRFRELALELGVNLAGAI